MSSIVVVGGCIVDLISYVSRFPKPGETIAGHHFCKGPGGKAANQCVMAQKLGSSTALIAKLGHDTFGEEYLESLKERKINTEHVSFSKTSHTSAANIVVSDAGQNCIVYVPGAIMELSPNDIHAAESLIKDAKILLCTFECPLKTLSAALTLARKNGVKTVLNAAPAADASYEELYPLIDIICMNEIEAEDATKLPLKDISGIPAVVDKLREKGCSDIIITLGSNGAVFNVKNGNAFVETKKVAAVDCTGAGDAFMGSLVYLLAEKPEFTFHNIVQVSCDIATLSVLKTGTQSSFPDRDEVPEEWFSKK